MSKGVKTSEYKQSWLVVACSVALPVVGLICDLLLEHKVLSGNGTIALVVGLLSSAIASAGYSYSRAVAKSAESEADAIKKKSIVVLSEKRPSGSTVEPGPSEA